MPGADPNEWDIRLGLWLTARRANPYRDTTTNVTAKPFDRSSSAYTIAESDIEAALTKGEQLNEAHAQLIAMQERLDYFESRVGAVYTTAFLESEVARMQEDAKLHARQLRAAFRAGFVQRGDIFHQVVSASGADSEDRAKEYADAIIAARQAAQLAHDTVCGARLPDVRAKNLGARVGTTCDLPPHTSAVHHGDGVKWVGLPTEEQQSAPATSGCRCGCPVVPDMCSCPTPCDCEPDCTFCLVPNPVRQPETMS